MTRVRRSISFKEEGSHKNYFMVLQHALFMGKIVVFVFFNTYKLLCWVLAVGKIFIL